MQQTLTSWENCPLRQYKLCARPNMLLLFYSDYPMPPPKYMLLPYSLLFHNTPNSSFQEASQGLRMGYINKVLV